jgi:ATP-dependent helicase/nuclease subunit B
VNLLVTSPSGGLRVRFAQDCLRKWTGHPRVLLVTASRGAGDDLARETGRGGLERSTLAQLALAVATPELARRGLTPIAGVALRAAVLRAIHRVHHRIEEFEEPVGDRVPADKALRYLGAIADTVGFPRALERTLHELRMQEVDRVSLNGAGPSGPDLGILLEAYRMELDGGGLADPATIFEVARETLETDRSCSRPPLLLLDVEVRNRVETRFLEALARRSAEVIAAVLPAAGRTCSHLEAALRTRARVISEDSEGGRALDRVRDRVFVAETPAGSEPDDTVVFFSATDEGRECAEIARHVQNAARRGLRFDDVAVLLRNPGVYQPLLEDALARAGIPAWYSRGVRRPNPAGRAFLCLLACRSEDFSASRFAEYLSLSQVPREEEPPASESHRTWVTAQNELFETALLETATDNRSVRAPDQWERLLVDASLSGGRERWEARLEGLKRELRGRVEATDIDNEAYRAYLLRQLEHLDALSRFALPLIGALAALPAEASWEDWLRRLEALARSSLAHPEPVLAVLAELRPMGPLGPVSLGDVEQVLGERLASLRVEMGGRRYGRVLVSTISEGASRSFSLVCLPGLSEGIFPRKAVEDPLLPDTFRNALAADLYLNADRIQEERLQLHFALGCARDRIVISYPRTDLAQGRARVPSFYALDILRTLEGRIPDLGQLERRAVEGSRSRLGWPSPIDPTDAIDDAEYDLATISALLHRPSGQVRGRARYLIEAHPALARSLRTRARRWKNFWSGADGLVDPAPETLGILEDHRPSQRAWSATSLEQYAACPYRLFLRGILQLSPRPEIVRIEQIDPLTRGRLFHEVQFRLFSALKPAGLLPVSEANLTDVTREADRVLDETAREFEAALAPAITTVWRTDIENMRTDLRAWLLGVAAGERLDPGWIPVRFELAFGLKNTTRQVDPESTSRETVLPGGLRLRGAIDLVEEHTDTGLLRVTDHKTGRPPAETLLATGHGEALQPLLYACAAEDLLERKVAVSRLAYCTQRGGFRNIDIPVDSGSRAQVDAIVRTIDTAIATGFLPAAPRRAACTQCDYRIVCGPYEELRTARKRPERLEPLEMLRRMP